MITYWQAKCIEEAAYHCVYGIVRNYSGYASDKAPHLTFDVRMVNNLHRKGLLMPIETPRGPGYKATRLGLYEATKRMSKHYQQRLKRMKELKYDTAPQSGCEPAKEEKA